MIIICIPSFKTAHGTKKNLHLCQTIVLFSSAFSPANSRNYWGIWFSVSFIENSVIIARWRSMETGRPQSRFFTFSYFAIFSIPWVPQFSAFSSLDKSLAHLYRWGRTTIRSRHQRSWQSLFLLYCINRKSRTWHAHTLWDGKKSPHTRWVCACPVTVAAVPW